MRERERERERESERAMGINRKRERETWRDGDAGDFVVVVERLNLQQREIEVLKKFAGKAFGPFRGLFAWRVQRRAASGNRILLDDCLFCVLSLMTGTVFSLSLSLSGGNHRSGAVLYMYAI